MEQKGMSVRVRALLARSSALPAARPESTGAPPRWLARRDRDRVGRRPAVPADRWRAVLIAGDNNSPAFDNGVEAMRDKLVQRGVRNITRPDVRSGRQSVAARSPPRPMSSSALRSGGGEACLVFITSHGDERGVVLRAAKGMVEPATLGNALDAGCGSRPTVVIVSACHSGIFLTPAMRQPNRVVLTAAAADRVELRLRRGRSVHLLRPVPAAAVRWRRRRGARWRRLRAPASRASSGAWA